jgi:hypothetical protein
MFPTIPQTQLNAAAKTPLLLREDLSGAQHLSEERKVIVSELERIWQKLTTSEKNAEPREVQRPRQPGSAIGTITIVAEDEEHLEAFRDYMP